GLGGLSGETQSAPLTTRTLAMRRAEAGSGARARWTQACGKANFPARGRAAWPRNSLLMRLGSGSPNRFWASISGRSLFETSGDIPMRAAQRLRTGLIALAALVGVGFSSSAYAASGTVRLQVIKAGWIIGGSGGGGSLTFQGKRYALSV